MRFLALLAVALLAAGCGSGAPPSDSSAASSGPDASATPAPTATAAGPRVVFLGDSISAGLHLDPEFAFPQVIAARLAEAGRPIELNNAGRSGDTTSGGLSRVDWLLSQSPDVLVVELGGNDGLRGIPQTLVLPEFSLNLV